MILLIAAGVVRKPPAPFIGYAAGITCPALPAPILNRHREGDTFRLPPVRVSVLNSQSAIAFFLASGQLPVIGRTMLGSCKIFYG